MSGILVITEHADGAFRPTAHELLGKASELGASLGIPVYAAVLGDAPAASLGGLGAQTVYQAAGDFGTYDTGATVDALSAIIRTADPDYILAPASFMGRDAMPRIAARFGSAMASDCTELKVEGGALVGRRPLYAGRAYADVAITARPAVMTIRPNTFARAESNGGDAEVVAVSWESSTPALTVIETLAPANTGIELSTASKVVAGGRSLKSKENFDSIIRPLGEVLAAGVGASRAATDAGYAPHSEQVGQTGQTVNPALYIAAGISGAIQHLAGMRTSKVICLLYTSPSPRDATLSRMPSSA